MNTQFLTLHCCVDCNTSYNDLSSTVASKDQSAKCASAKINKSPKLSTALQIRDALPPSLPPALKRLLCERCFISCNCKRLFYPTLNRPLKYVVKISGWFCEIPNNERLTPVLQLNVKIRYFQALQKIKVLQKKQPSQLCLNKLSK